MPPPPPALFGAPRNPITTPAGLGQAKEPARAVLAAEWVRLTGMTLRHDESRPTQGRLTVTTKTLTATTQIEESDADRN